MSDEAVPRERWLEHLGRVLALSEERKGRLDADELIAVARDLGITPADLELAAKEAQDHFTRGAGFAARGLWDDAIAELTEARAYAPTRLDISLELARAHHHRGKSGDRPVAERIARLALEWEPTNATAFAVLAELAADERGRRARRRAALVGGLAALGLLTAYLVGRSADETQRPADETQRPAAPAREVPAATAPAPHAAPPKGAPDPECPQHSTFIHGQGCVAQDLEIVPGVGFGELRLGQSTAEEALATLGDDAKLNRHPDGELYQINYAYSDGETYDPARRRNWSRPDQLSFKRGVLVELEVGVYNRQLRTPGGLNTQRSTLADAEREFGERYELTHGEKLDQYRWPRRGVEVWVSPEHGTVNSFRVIPIEP